MRATMAVACALAAFVAAAQAQAPQGEALCRSFCDADAKACRSQANENAQNEVAPFNPDDFNVHAHPQTPHDDFSDQKKRAVENAASKGHFEASQKCVATRQACVQRCTARPAAAASGASGASR